MGFFNSGSYSLAIDKSNCLFPSKSPLKELWLYLRIAKAICSLSVISATAVAAGFFGTKITFSSWAKTCSS